MGFSSSFSSPSCGDLSSFSHSAFFFITTSLSVILLSDRSSLDFSASSLTQSNGYVVMFIHDCVIGQWTFPLDRNAPPSSHALSVCLATQTSTYIAFGGLLPLPADRANGLPPSPLSSPAPRSLFFDAMCSKPLFRKYECLVTVSAKMGKCPPPPSRNASVRGQERWVKPRQFKSKLCKTELVARVRP